MGFSMIDIPDLGGRCAVVTGANSGIGWHTANGLARAGAFVVLACRDVERGKQAADRIRAGYPRADVDVAEIDLSSMESVRSFAGSWDGSLDLLINNAGVMAPPRYTTTRDGFELQFGTNHLGHFALTGLLLPALLAAPAARVTSVSSLAHHGGTVAVLAANSDKVRYDRKSTYANSKLANLLFSTELQRLAALRGSALTSTAAHPGLSYTGLVTDSQGIGANSLLRLIAPPFVRAVTQSAAHGALPTLYAATLAEPGSYSGPQHLSESRGGVGPARRSKTAQDEKLARELWRVSEELTGLRYAW
jgi:NAD(P)-dependent dehydrogenase (short-subunit alcohol dehydrogenase family)